MVYLPQLLPAVSKDVCELLNAGQHATEDLCSTGPSVRAHYMPWITFMRPPAGMQVAMHRWQMPPAAIIIIIKLLFTYIKDQACPSKSGCQAASLQHCKNYLQKLAQGFSDHENNGLLFSFYLML